MKDRMKSHYLVSKYTKQQPLCIFHSSTKGSKYEVKMKITLNLWGECQWDRDPNGLWGHPRWWRRQEEGLSGVCRLASIPHYQGSWRNSFKAVRSLTSYPRWNPLFCERIWSKTWSLRNASSWKSEEYDPWDKWTYSSDM